MRLREHSACMEQAHGQTDRVIRVLLQVENCDSEAEREEKVCHVLAVTVAM